MLTGLAFRPGGKGCNSTGGRLSPLGAATGRRLDLPMFEELRRAASVRPSARSRRLNRDDFRCGNAIPVTLRAGMIHFVAIFFVQFAHGLNVFYFPPTLSWQAPLPVQADESPNPRPASTLNDV